MALQEGDNRAYGPWNLGECCVKSNQLFANCANGGTMLTLYYSPGASSMTPHISLEKIGAPYERKLVGEEPRYRWRRTLPPSAPILARPGGNVTGVFMQQIELTPKRLELLTQTVP